LSATFVAGLVLIVGAIQISCDVLAQTSSSDDSAHFAYDAGAPLNVREISVKTQDGVTIQDITSLSGIPKP
jgi:hypothetical protein